MSYCHTLPGGFANIDIRFHQRCITEQMLPADQLRRVLDGVERGRSRRSARFYTGLRRAGWWTRAARAGPIGGPALAANSDRTFVVGGQCGVPSTAKAVSVNVSVTQASSAGNLRLYAGGTGLPNATAINYRANQTRAQQRARPPRDGRLAGRPLVTRPRETWGGYNRRQRLLPVATRRP